MKPFSSQFSLFFVAAIALIFSALFSACDDDSTSVSEVTEHTGMVILAKGEKLPECGKDNVGKMLYLSASAVYYCIEGKWTALDGEDGISCVSEAVEGGVEVSCGGKAVGFVANGVSGKNCSVKTNVDGESYTISCEGSADVIVKNGASGIFIPMSSSEIISSSSVVGSSSSEEDSSSSEMEESSSSEETSSSEESSSSETLSSSGVVGSSSSEDASSSSETEESSSSEESSGSTESSSEAESSSGEVLSSSSEQAIPYTTACPTGETCTYAPTDLLNPNKTYGEYLATRDYQMYKTITIKSQTWIAQNMNYVPKSETEVSYCYDNKASNCDKYGRLYSWNTAMKACPEGWHLPSNDEWIALIYNVGYSVESQMTFAGEKLKSTNGWEIYTNSSGETYNGNGDDSYGFSIVPGGYRNQFYSRFQNIEKIAIFWTSTVSGDDGLVWVYYSMLPAMNDKDEKRNNNSVRCIKDSN